MKQQANLGKSLGGRTIAVPQQEKRETEADRLRLGGELFQDISGLMERGEQVPDDLFMAMEDYRAQAALMLTSPNASTRETYALMLQHIEDGFAARAHEDEVRTLMAGITGQPQAGANLTKGVQPFEMPEVPDELESRAFEFGPENIRALAIQSNPLEQDNDGRTYVTDQDGIRWELTEALATLNQPTVKEHLRQSLMGQIPGQAAASATVGAMALPQLAIEGAGALGISENRRNVPTAFGGQTLPWLVGFNADGSMRGDELDKLMDPVWARALSETANALDVRPKVWESFAHALALGVDFAAFHKLLGVAGQGLRAAAGASRVPLGQIGATMARGARALPEVALPFNSVAKTALEFGLYDALAQSTNPDTALPEDFTRGLGTGLVFGAAGRISKFLRHQTVGRATTALFPELKKMDDVTAAIRRVKDPILTRELEAIQMSRAARNALDHSIEAYLTGVMVHAYGEAQRAPEGEGFKTFWSKLFDPNGQATGLGFALNSALMFGLRVRPEIGRQFESPEFKALTNRVASEFANPRAGQPVREAYEAFERLRAADPAAFEGLTFRSPAKQEAQRNRVVEEQRRREERPVDAAPALAEMRADDAAAGERFGLTVGEFNPDRLRILGFTARSNTGVFKHALNATNEYLREIEGATGDAYYRFSDVPNELFRRVLEWRDLGKPSKRELLSIERMKELEGDAPSPSTDPAVVARLRGQRQLELTERPGAAGEQVQGVRPKAIPDTAAPGSIAEAERIYQRARGEPKHAGLAPIEVVEKDRGTPRRPSLGRALELVASGKKDAEWIRQTFPEGAAEVGQGRPEEWAGRFERAVRKTWADRRARSLRQAQVVQESQREHRIQNWIRSIGGIQHDKEMAGELSRLREEGGRKLVRGKGTGKGTKLDDVAEAAVEAGFFAERPTINELLDAIESNIERLDVAGQRELERGEAERAQVFEGQLVRRRDDIEGAREPLPPREELFAVFAGDPRYAGFTPERLEREIVQLRRQTEAGDPGARMAGPPDGPRELAHRASVASSRAVEVLRVAGVVPDVAVNSPEALEGLEMALSRREAPPGVDPALWREARTHAALAREATRDVVRSSSPAERVEKLADLWAYSDARERGEPPDPEVAARMAKRNWLDEYGNVRTQVVDRLQQITAEEMRRATEAPDIGFQSGMGGLLSTLAFGARKFADVTENLWGSKLTWAYWLDKPEVQRLVSSGWGKRLFDLGKALGGRNLIAPVVNLGPVSRPQTSAMRAKGERLLFELGRGRGRQEEALMAARMVSTLFHAPWQGLRPPESHQEFLIGGMERGDFRNAKGPADFEAMRPGTGYLFEVYTRARDLFEQLGREQVELGRMTQAQLDALGGGRYVMHEYVRGDVQGEQAEIASGRYPIRHVGRSLRRQGRPSPDEPAMRITDFGYLVERAAFQESQSGRVWAALERYMDPRFEWALSSEQVNRLGPLDRADYQAAAVKVERMPGESMPDAIARMVASGRYPREAVLMGARLMLDREQMAKRGVEPKEGQRPYTKRMDELYRFWLGESARGPIHIPRSHAEELEMSMTDLFAPPQGASAVAQAIDKAFAFKKRGLTVLRPQSWALMIGSNATRNAALGGPPLNDFVRGMLGGAGWTRDGLNGGRSYLRWVGEGAPKEKPESWSDAEWADFSLARDFLGFAGSSASLVQSLGTEFTARLGAVLSDPATTRGAWEAQLQEAVKGRAWTTEQVDRMRAAIAQKTDAMFSGLEGWDAKLSEQLGSHDPADQARAIASFHTLWNLTDLFMFKYPAFLKLRHENPDVPIERLAHRALSFTGHAGDTDPWLRRHASMHGPWADELWRAAQGKTKVGPIEVENARAKLFLGQFIRDRFWIDRASVFPQLVRASVAHPLRMSASYGLMAGIAGGIWAMLDDDERERRTEEAKTARRALTRWGATDPKLEEALRRVNGRVGTIGGVTLQVPEWAQGAVVDFWDRLKLKDPGTVPLPKKGGESRIGSIGSLFPAGELLQTVQGAAKLNPFGIESRDEASEFLMGVEQFFGMRAQMAAQLGMALIGRDSLIADGLGMGGASEKFARVMFDLVGSAGTLYPTLGLFTPEGQFMGEAVANGGRPWTDGIRGLVPLYQPDRKGEDMAAAGLRLLWPSRALYQREPLSTPIDADVAILQEMYGPGFTIASAQGMERWRAHTWARRQFSIMLGDLYEQHFDEATDPAKAHIDLDDRMRGALQETLEATEVNPVTDLGQIQPNHEPRSVLLRGIAALEPELQGHAIAHLRRWIGGQHFQQDGYGMLYEAGRKLEMSKGLFREAMLNALNDPSGSGLVKWWSAKVEEGDEDVLRELAPLIWDVAVPGGGDALVAYRQLFLRYTRAGYDWPPVPDSVNTDQAVPGAPEHGRALQGAPAFKRVLRQRPETAPALDALLLNPR